MDLWWLILEWKSFLKKLFEYDLFTGVLVSELIPTVADGPPDDGATPTEPLAADQ